MLAFMRETVEFELDVVKANLSTYHVPLSVELINFTVDFLALLVFFGAFRLVIENTFSKVSRVSHYMEQGPTQVELDSDLRRVLGGKYRPDLFFGHSRI